MFGKIYLFVHILLFIGQFLRVGKAITPPEGLSTATPGTVASMPTATALAVATITAQLQAKEVETNPQPALVSLFYRQRFNCKGKPLFEKLVLKEETNYFALFISLKYFFQAAAQMINNPIAQVGYLGGPIAPTTVAAALSAASFSGATAVSSSIIEIIFEQYWIILCSMYYLVISTILNPTAAIPTPIPQSVAVGSTSIRSK